MNERVLIIVGIIAQYFMSESNFSNEREIVEELIGAGFKEDEINEAFSWMEQITLTQDPDHDTQQLQSPQMRIFSPQEQTMLSVAARGFLVNMRLSGILSSELEEEIIIKACQNNDGASGIDDVKSITVLTLFANIQRDHSREIDCILTDKMDKLYN